MNLGPAHAINLRGHDEIALREAVDLVSPNRDVNFAPRQQNVGMVSLLLGYRANAVYEFERLLEVGEFEFAMQVMLFVNRPLWNTSVQFLQLQALDRRNASAAGNAGFVGKLFGHIASQSFGFLG
jgi:hypothetical protein